jgi:hypothetical protein
MRHRHVDVVVTERVSNAHSIDAVCEPRLRDPHEQHGGHVAARDEARGALQVRRVKRKQHQVVAVVTHGEGYRRRRNEGGHHSQGHFRDDVIPRKDEAPHALRRHDGKAKQSTQTSPTCTDETRGGSSCRDVPPESAAETSTERTRGPKRRAETAG